MNVIKFKRTTQFLGRNGCFKSTGVSVGRLYNGDDKIKIEPITSKDKPARCYVYIPQEDIPELIETLKELVNDERQGKIKRIKDILSTWGGTTVSELELDHSPCIHSQGNKLNISHLVEQFNPDCVTVVVYANETETSEYEQEYEQLSDDILDEIALIIDDYEADMLKTEKRCSN